MKTYRVVASQLVYHEKFIQAKDQEQAEDLAWEYDQGNDWKEFQYGDWEIEDVTLAKVPA